MEKRQLVRTFGTALATATLSFGLFAAPAIADTQEIEGTAVVATTSGNDDVAVVGEGVEITIPAAVSTDLKNVVAGTMTFESTDGTHGQELTVGFDPSSVDNHKTKIDDVVKGSFAFKYEVGTNGQTVITAIMAKFDVTEQLLSGSWSLKDIVLKDAAGKEIVTLESDVTFKVEGDENPADFALNLESIMTKQHVYRDSKNTLYVKTKGNSPETPSAKAIATYENPAGVEQSYPADKVANTHTYEFENLDTSADGLYNLKSLTLKDAGEELDDQDTGGKQGITKLTNFVTYDDLAILSDGDYVVSNTGVEAMMRLYNQWTGEHIYTNDMEEVVGSVAAGWTFEGLAWYAPVDGMYKDAVSPVYRLYNQYNGEHHYTTSSVEAATLVAAGWTDEGVGFYTTTKGDKNAQAVYRLFNQYAEVGTHHYTTDKDEYDALVEVGWTGENVGWYGVNVPEYEA